MAKTVFGMPGVGSKPGDDNTSKDSAATPNAAGTSGSPAPNAPSQGRAPVASPNRPGMARPQGAQAAMPMARPVGGGGAGVPIAGGKTVFGMPAVKVPVKSQPPAAPPEEESRPMYAATESLSATGPRGAAVAKAAAAGQNQAFKATMVGMAAMRPEDGTPSNSPDFSLDAMVSSVPPGALTSTPPGDVPAIDDIAFGDSDSPQASDESGFSAPKKSRPATGAMYAAPQAESNKMGILIFIATLVLAGLVVVGRYFLFSDEPAPASQMIGPSGVPGVPGVPPVPGVPGAPPPVPPVPGVPGAPSAAVPPVPPVPGVPAPPGVPPAPPPPPAPPQ